MEKQVSYLELEVIWKDEEMIELNISASNGYYSGVTQVYDSTDSLYSLSQLLIGFGVGNKSLFYETGVHDGYAYFSIKMYCIDNAGHIGALINLEKNCYGGNRLEEKDKISLELLIEPSSIDNFQKALLNLAKTEEGKAVLYGLTCQ